ncbi:hypothetical protein WR25_04214 [Diploscapter pachys]|uniref:Lupus La protein n=1 Tax=Diploscapter pachys TaxID=2018661 RepID=A0A2A2K182_9BILA|nr:hypothetical protein WR25_04214 [Diploscapter pachys]
MAGENGNSGAANGGDVELDNKIVNQLEYYFGNINLPRDKFLQGKLKDDEGWVPIDVLLTFNRLALITTDKERIGKAVKEADSEVISVSEDLTKIRRNIGNPLPENSLEYWQQIKARTVYMKGFPVDAKLDEVQTFAKKFGNVENVLMRRIKADRIFKGSCFITYKTREEAENAAKSEDNFAEGEMTKLMQDEYWVKKNRETKEKRAAEKLAKLAKKNEELAAKRAAKQMVHFTKGLILAVENVPKNASVNELKEFFNQFAKVGYIVHEPDQTNAEIRFEGTEDAAKTAWEKAQSDSEGGKVMFKENELTGRVLEGEEEDKYWTAFNSSKFNKIANKQGRGRGRGRGRGGRGGRHGGGDRSGGHQGRKTVFKDDGEGEKEGANGNQEKSDKKRAHEEAAGDGPVAKKTKE